jgi:hypothetical protein
VLEARLTAPVISESPPPSLGSEPTPIELSATDIRRTSSGWRARCIHKRGIPWEIEAIVDGVRVAPEVEQTGRRFVVRWQDRSTW